MSERQHQKPQEQVERWNAAHPDPAGGVKVAVRRDSGTTTVTTTRSRAEVLSGHTAVIWLDGISGCYMLNRVTAITEDVTAEQHGSDRNG